MNHLPTSHDTDATGAPSIQSDPGRQFQHDPPTQSQDSVRHTATAGLLSTSTFHHRPASLRDASSVASTAPRHGGTQSKPPPSTAPSGGDDPIANEPSFQDRLAATALSGTLELLKQVGGVTLSTTGALVAPPLHLTRTVLLPNLWAASLDYLATSSPVRLKDWFRIVHTSLYHIWHTLQNTEAGHAVSNRFWIVATDVLECLVADTTRQVLLDSMACLVKWAECVATPECHAWMDQVAVTLCRTVDALSHGRTKLWLHDARLAVRALTQLLADPVTTTALAEVTAYLCYALEMEQHTLDSDHGSRRTANGIGSRTVYERRHERDDYQRETTHRDTLDAGRTVEQVILDSLGDSNIDTTHTDLDEDSGEPSARTTATSVRYQGAPHKDQTAPPEAWHERVRRDVNVNVLRAGIEQRAVSMQAQQHERRAKEPRHEDAPNPPHGASDIASPTTRDEAPPHANAIRIHDLEEIGGVVTVDEDEDDEADDDTAEASASTRRPRVQVNSLPEGEALNDKTIVGFLDDVRDGPTNDVPIPSRLEGETPVQQFHRILDEILSDKREAAVRETLRTGSYHNSTVNAVKALGKLRRRPTESTNGTSDRNSVRDRLAALRAELTTEPSNVEMARLDRIKAVFGKEGKMELMVGIAVVAAISLFWISFGCYGVYMFLQPNRMTTSFHAPPVVPRQPTPMSRQEIVIRIVRDDRDYESSTDLTASPAQLENVAQCVATAFK